MHNRRSAHCPYLVVVVLVVVVDISIVEVHVPGVVRVVLRRPLFIDL